MSATDRFIAAASSWEVFSRRASALPASAVEEADLVSLVEQCPMHVNEIDLMARQAVVHSLVRGGSGHPSVAEVRQVIAKYRGPKKSPAIFGGA